jgi:pilus assembly protein CpaB
MRRGGRILVLLGIVLGLLTAGGTFLVISTAQSQGQQIPTKSVVIAQQNIFARTEILPDAVGKAEWPEAFLPPGAFEKPDEVIGKLALEPIYQGQIILPPMILDKTKVKETRSNASFLIPEGKVAVAFPLSTLSGVAGAVQNGDYVDLLLTLTPVQGTKAVTGTTTTTGGEGLAVAQLMLQDVLILNVGAWGGAQDKNAPPGAVVTFVLDRQDALALKAAREQGTIELALRRANDHKLVTTEPVSLQYLNKRFNFNLIPPSK